MPKFPRLTLTVALLALAPLPALAQVASRYGQPITDVPSEDLICYMETRDGRTLDLAKLCGGTPQVATAPSQRQSAGLVFSNIKFSNPTRAEREVGRVGLKVRGQLINRSNQTIDARVVDYTISAFNGRQWNVIVSASESLSKRFTRVVIPPGESISFEHELDTEQAKQFNGYMMFPENFRFEVKDTNNNLEGLKAPY